MSFEEAKAAVFQSGIGFRGIGTLGEKTLHAVLKQYYQPDSSLHEKKIGPYVADICSTDADGIEHIWEIQTRHFYVLEEKLLFFLDQGKRVTVVYPVPLRKWICWVDMDTGEVSSRRKSPKTGGPWEILKELPGLKSCLEDPRLTFQLAMLEVEDYRCLNGWSGDRKRGSTRWERIPLTLVQELSIQGKQDLLQLLPPGLPDIFTAKDFQRAARFSSMGAGGSLKLLTNLGILERVGKRGRAYLYQIAPRKRRREISAPR